MPNPSCVAVEFLQALDFDLEIQDSLIYFRLFILGGRISFESLV